MNIKSDFFDKHTGNARDHMKTPIRARLKDIIADGALSLKRKRLSITSTALNMPRQRVLVVGVEVPSRGDALNRICARLSESRHEVLVSTVTMKLKGKFENINDAISQVKIPLSEFDWLIITDDDVLIPPKFIDTYLATATLTDLVISQPAHKFLSYTTYNLTQRRLWSLARETNFVEIGPLTVLRRNCFKELIPFPRSRWAYGIDLLWAEICKRNAWRMGVVDLIPIRHLRPVANTYDMAAAREEGKMLIEQYGIGLHRSELMQVGKVLL